MASTTSTEHILTQLSVENVKMGDLKKLAKEIKRDHDLAMELWASEKFYPRMLAVLIMDKKQLDQEFINRLVGDLETHEMKEQVQIVDWLMANQLMKDKKTLALLQSWQKASLPLLRRLFWYHQGRLRWTGQTPPENTVDLLSSLEADMASAEPEVQWAMNLAACWIGVYQPEHRSRCVELGERVGLYKDKPVQRGCSPEYMPEFIRVEAAKREAG